MSLAKNASSITITVVRVGSRRRSVFGAVAIIVLGIPRLNAVHMRRVLASA